MSLHAVAVALASDLKAEVKLCLIYLGERADDRGISVPDLPRLAEKIGVGRDDLRLILDELVEDGLISPVSEHPFDFIANTEGFQLNLDDVTVIEREESPWSKELARNYDLNRLTRARR